jgi:hypothetical protein
MSDQSTLISSGLIQVVLESRDAYWSSLLPIIVIVERSVQSQALPSRISRNASIGVGLCDKLLAPGVNQKTNQIRSHIVSSEVRKRFRQVAFVEIDL